METVQLDLRFVVFQEGELWVAQCLEYDIGTQAKSMSDLLTQLDLTLQAEIRESTERHGSPLAGIDPAPKYFRDMLESGVGGCKPVPVGEPRSLPGGGITYGTALCA